MLSSKYTLAGIGAIILWSTTIAFVRSVTEQLGAIGGSALIYTVSSILLIMTIGLPKISSFPKKYLLIGGGLFISYEVCLSLALGLANSRSQAVEMGIINYLWPSLTVVFSLLISRKPISIPLLIAILLSFFGVAWTSSGENGLSFTTLLNNFQSNPISYSLALTGAFLWAIYCNITKYLANGKNAITWFFIGTAISLWFKYLISDEAVMVFTTSATIDLFLAAAVMAGGYALWNVAIIHGNMVLLAILSYFTPLLSTLFSAYLLNLTLGIIFWQGVLMVTIASLLCWFLTRKK
ncbi:aromatic amino acid DMT transporter YddG [Vibrio sp. SS-MA-C1-2]|uniref:aromatic amino acid DMT transporter YddG n=1 Tax=Vibrio sp. SS-MA-C1-2 TaxID=2908646 RepID=UPI001F3AB00D|nr:aromatic amino acid DMT transporter YddG [Vibrio sp. SS-MA-C1-2]UJF18224.1 aromatic amino acid DMT transporter YddG [Vibrio sp. SS-MA-C1-2]